MEINLLGHAGHASCPTTDYNSYSGNLTVQHTNCLSLNWSDNETFIYSRGQNLKFLRSKNRQKFFRILPNLWIWYLQKMQPSLLVSYHRRWWMFSWYSICRNMLTVTFLKTSVGLKHGSLLHAQTDSLSMLFCSHRAYVI